MYLVFFKTNDVFLAEEKLNENDINTEVVPTPVQDKAYCGVCLNIPESEINKANNILKDIEYSIVEKR